MSDVLDAAEQGDGDGDGETQSSRSRKTVGKSAPSGSALDKILTVSRAVDADAAAWVENRLGYADSVDQQVRDLEAEIEKVRSAFAPVPPPTVGTDRVEACGLDLPKVSDNAGNVTDKGFDPSIWRSRISVNGQSCWVTPGDMASAIEQDHNVLLVGPPSVGKTALVKWLAEASGWPFIRVNMTRDTTLDDLVGGYEAVSGSTEWVDGPLLCAMRIGAILLVDEIDHAPGEVTSVLHPPLERGDRRLTVAAHGGEEVIAADTFRIVATANTAGYGDDSGRHGAARVQDTALLSRFSVTMVVDWPTHEDEARMLMRRTGVNEDFAKSAVAVANASREAADNGTLFAPLGLRHTMAWCELRSAGWPVAKAFAVTIVAQAPNEDREALVEIAQRFLDVDFGDEDDA